MSPFHRSSLICCADVVERELDGRAEQVHVVRQVAHHAVGVAEGERGVVGLVPHALRDAIEVHQARQVQLRADGAAPVGEIDGGVAALERLDLDEGNHLLHLRQQSVLEGLRRKAGHRRGERVGGVRRRDLDQRNAEAAGVVREHLPGQRFVGEPAGVGGGAVAVVVGGVVGERAVGTVLRLPEVAERAPVGVAQEGAPHGEAFRARAQEEALLDLGVAAPELVDRHVRMAGPPERVVRNDGERAGGDDVRNRDVADLVGHSLNRGRDAEVAARRVLDHGDLVGRTANEVFGHLCRQKHRCRGCGRVGAEGDVAVGGRYHAHHRPPIAALCTEEPT